MALGSPGVEVQVIDESFYTPAAPGTTPLIFVATAQDKSNASSTGIAQGTLAANAGKVWVITGQRDLSDTFGTPLFYTDNNSNPIHGGELNEYGLQAAYSLLGVSSSAYVVRADVDLSELSAESSAPKGDPVAGTYWLDTDASLYGINEWNSTTKKFTVKTPLIINDDNKTTDATLVDQFYIPKDSFGKAGDYAMVVTSNNNSTLYYKTTTATNPGTGNYWAEVDGGVDGGKLVTISPHTSYPNYTIGTPTGSVWIKTTTPGFGSNWVVKYYNGSTQSWSTVGAPLYNSTRQALQVLDYAGGGKNIPVGTLFIESDYDHRYLETGANVDYKIWRRNSTAATTIVSNASTATNAASSSFTIRETMASTSTWGTGTTITIPGSSVNSVASLIPAAISNSGLVNVTANYDAGTKKLTFTHILGGDIELNNSINTPLTIQTNGVPMFSAYNVVTKLGTPNLYQSPITDQDNEGQYFDFIASNWKPLVYEAKNLAPYTDPADGRLWYSSVVDQLDIMVHNGDTWVGYRDATAFPNTDPAGPMVAALEPTLQSNGNPLQNGDIWVSTADLEMYGKNIYVWNGDSLLWVLQDTADQTTPDGWLFADARWSTSGSDAEPATIIDLLSSNYLDPDAPDPALYPKGMKLWNLRRSGFNVKKYIRGHINIAANEGLNIRYQNDDMSTYESSRWVTVSPNQEDGSGSFGRMAQRSVVVKAFKAMIDTNQAIRDIDTLVFNLIACPGYPETIQNMIAFNTDRGVLALVVGDTPFRLKPNATDLLSWGNNTQLVFDNGDKGAVSYDSYMAMFYPSGFTTDNTGNNIVVPPSHMMLRTIVNSDAKSYQWFAPAGTRRGNVDNATSVGYINEEGEFKPAALYEGLRNTMSSVKINPIATLPGVGIVNFGQYTRAANASALDRINVARLVIFLRRQLTILAKPFLFEPNDAQTRREIKAAAESLLLELVGQRALYDFIVVCDSSNNTPARIDRSELYMDIAIEPVKAVEFIYIPLRLKNTGDIAAGL